MNQVWEIKHSKQNKDKRQQVNYAPWIRTVDPSVSQSSYDIREALIRNYTEQRAYNSHASTAKHRLFKNGGGRVIA